MNDERNALNEKVKKLSNDLLRLEENLAFFGPSKGVAGLREGVEKKIDNGKRQLEELQWKLSEVKKHINRFHQDSKAKEEAGESE